MQHFFETQCSDNYDKNSHQEQNCKNNSHKHNKQLANEVYTHNENSFTIAIQQC